MEPVRVGVIGFGMMGRMQAVGCFGALQEEFRLAAGGTLVEKCCHHFAFATVEYENGTRANLARCIREGGRPLADMREEEERFGVRYML